MPYRSLMDKMARIIDTSTIEHKAVVERYISLANKQLHEEYERSKKKAVFGDWGIIGGSMALKERFETKFGPFIPKREAIHDLT